MILVQFACTHQVQVDAALRSPPVCVRCGETRIVHSSAPPPTFSGAASGPCAVGGTVRPLTVPVVAYADDPEPRKET